MKIIVVSVEIKCNSNDGFDGHKIRLLGKKQNPLELRTLASQSSRAFSNYTNYKPERYSADKANKLHLWRFEGL
jgi:hypothetical protein